MSTARLLAAASRVDDYFAGRLGAVVPDETRVALLAELSAAVAEAKHDTFVTEQALALMREDVEEAQARMEKAESRLAYIAKAFWNAIRYCCGNDDDNWQNDFIGTLDRRMKKQAEYETKAAARRAA